MSRLFSKPRRRIHIFAVIVVAAGVLSCADPRTPPPTAPDPRYSETVVLWQAAASNGQTLSADFSVDGQLAAISQPGRDAPARLTVAAYIRPDADVGWYEAIVNDSIPDWTDDFIRYLIGAERQQGVIDSVARIRALCDTLPAECPSDTSGLAPAETAAQGLLAQYQDSLAAATADTTRLGDVRDSLGLVLDDRFTLALWLDSDTLTVYPDALISAAGVISGQALYLAETNATTGLKGRGFSLDLAQFAAADFQTPGRPIELNWTTCFPGSNRPCLSPGSHTLRARVSGAETKITATLVLVYREERP